jgi:hypothetical protein
VSAAERPDSVSPPEGNDMEFITSLWLPILLSGVFVFLVSSVLHMLIPVHCKDFQKLVAEDDVRAAMRTAKVEPGEYMFPFPNSMKEMGSPEMLAKYKEGPVGWLTLLPNGPPAIGKSLVQWFLYSLVIGVFVAYVSDLSLEAGAESMMVFRLSGTVAFLAYGIGYVTNSIWKAVAWSTTLKYIFDGLLYALTTAATFAWLWPGA